MQPPLPIESWTEIFGYLDLVSGERRAAILSMAQTCRSAYQQVLPHLYRDLGEHHLLHPSLLETLNRKPHLGHEVTSVTCTFKLELNPLQAYTYDATSEPLTVEECKEATLKQAATTAQSIAKSRWSQILAVLRFCPNIADIRFFVAMNWSINLLDNEALLKNFPPTPTAAALADLPFLKALRTATFRYDGYVTDHPQFLQIDWSPIIDTLALSTTLTSLTIPAHTSFDRSFPAVTDLRILYDGALWEYSQSHEWSGQLSQLRSTFPSLHTVTYDAWQVKLTLNHFSVSAESAKKMTIWLQPVDEFEAWRLETWLPGLLSSTPNCPWLELSFYRTGAYTDTPMQLAAIFDLIARRRPFAHNLKRVAVSVQQRFPSEETVVQATLLVQALHTMPLPCSFIPSTAYLPLLSAKSFPKLDYLIMDTSTDGLYLALRTLGLEHDHCLNAQENEWPDDWEYYLQRNFNRLVHESRKPRETELELVWKLNSPGDVKMWTTIKQMKYSEGKIRVQHEQDCDVRREFWQSFNWG